MGSKRFYEQLGQSLQLGLIEGSTIHDGFAEWLHYHTSKSGKEQISLKEYVDRMKQGQEDIYYITGESIAQVSSSQCLKSFRARGIEVLYMVDHVDELLVQQFTEFDGKKLKSVLSCGADNSGSGRQPRQHRRRKGASAGEATMR